MTQASPPTATADRRLLHDCNSAVVAIGGLDPSGGAGLLADARVAQALNTPFRAVAALLTAQTDTAFRGAWTVDPECVAEQVATAVDGLERSILKIGAIGSLDLAGLLASAGSQAIVVDPVLNASSGGVLVADGSAAWRQLAPVCTLATPNLDELTALTGQPVSTERERLAAARQLLDDGAQAVLVKGGHAPTDERIYDLLVTKQETARFTHDRRNTAARGTGCALATAIACFLCSGEALHDAVRSGIAFLQRELSDPRSRVLRRPTVEKPAPR